MAYNVELSAEVDRELSKLDAQQAKRILKFLHD
jgi:mRNA-degrading endonuclease RelE of RelBE toxin-antitoxin system